MLLWLLQETMATVGHYSVYAALLQTTVEGPEFADVGVLWI